jgi:hypothetical protein
MKDPLYVDAPPLELTAEQERGLFAAQLINDCGARGVPVSGPRLSA